LGRCLTIVGLSAAIAFWTGIVPVVLPLQPEGGILSVAMAAAEQDIPQPEECAQPAEALREAIEQAKRSWEEGNASTFAELFAPDGEFIVPGQRWVGPAAITTVAAGFAKDYRDVTIEIRQIITSGNRALAEWYWEDTNRSTGKRSRADDAIAVDMKAGKVVRWREYIDTQTPKLSEPPPTKP
jgi:uncharacterized protein (TIGR02246 family)